MTDPCYEWVPLKVYAAEKGRSERTVRRWIKLHYVDAQREGDAPQGRWLIKVISHQQAAS